MAHENRHYRLGLDLGTNSVGWACVEKDALGKAADLLDWGVYVFPESFEEDDQGVRVTTASERGQKRRARRTLRRRRYRRNVLTRLLTERGLLPADPDQRAAELTKHAVWQGDALHEVHPYAIRARAVTERVEPYELGKALYHMCRHRGFLSTRELMQLSLQF
ncbi:MAG: type II CRISPR RNA-guided endonuclease Cas9, partial [Fimbriimonadaceae bacterium]